MVLPSCIRQVVLPVRAGPDRISPHRPASAWRVRGCSPPPPRGARRVGGFPACRAGVARRSGGGARFGGSGAGSGRGGGLGAGGGFGTAGWGGGGPGGGGGVALVGAAPRRSRFVIGAPSWAGPAWAR